LLDKLYSTIPTLWNIPITKPFSEKLGLGLDNPVKTVFLEFLVEQPGFKGVLTNDRHLSNRGFVSYAILEMSPQLDNIYRLDVQTKGKLATLEATWAPFDRS
jgi:hypothetical protein